MLCKGVFAVVLALGVGAFYHLRVPKHHTELSDLSPMFRGGEEGEWFRSPSTGLWLYTAASAPAGGMEGARAHVLLAHGYAQHGGMFDGPAERLAAAGYAVHRIDHQGHGRSEGDRLFVASFDDYTHDVVEYAASLAEGPAAGKPLFVLGHSLGGLIAIRAAMAKPALFAGAIFSAPALAVDPAINTTALRWLSTKLSARVPHMPLARVVLDGAYTDKALYAPAYADPLACFSCWSLARTGAEVLAAIDHTLANARRFSTPYLLLQGTADTHVPSRGADAFHPATSSADKTYVTFPDFAHELLFEPHPRDDDVFTTIVSWLDDHVDANADA